MLNVADFNQDVLGLKVGVDNAALAVEIVEAEQNLLGDLLDEGHGDTAMVPALDKAQEILTEDLKDHTYVGTVGALVLKRVEEADDVLTAGVIRLGLDDAVEKLNLVYGGLGVMGGRADDL